TASALLQRQPVPPLAEPLEHERIADLDPPLATPAHHARLFRRARAEHPGAVLDVGLEAEIEIGLDRDRLDLVGPRRVLRPARTDRVAREELENVPERWVALRQRPQLLF